MRGSQTKVLTSCEGHVQKFHCGLPRGLIHSVTLTLTGVYKYVYERMQLNFFEMLKSHFLFYLSFSVGVNVGLSS
jgi:hypothetical protein